MASTSTSVGLPSATASSTYNAFSAIASSAPNSGTFGLQPGSVNSDPSSQAGQDAAGASGSSDGSLDLSTGATVAIIVVAVLVVLATATTAVLFYLTKKRQWAVRDSLRRSVRRVTRRDRPEGLRTGDSTRNGSRGVIHIDSPLNSARSQPNRGEKTPMLTEAPWKRDVEKGYKGKKPLTPATPVPLSSFDMDSPRNAQGPIWAKILFMCMAWLLAYTRMNVTT